MGGRVCVDTRVHVCAQGVLGRPCHSRLLGAPQGFGGPPG